MVPRVFTMLSQHQVGSILWLRWRLKPSFSSQRCTREDCFNTTGSCFLQVTEQIYESVWTQWVADTHSLIERLPTALSAQSPPEQDMLTFERWLILLKVLVLTLLNSYTSANHQLVVKHVSGTLLQSLSGGICDTTPSRMQAHSCEQADIVGPNIHFPNVQALRRLVVFGFESDTKSLRQVPVVSQVRAPRLQ